MSFQRTRFARAARSLSVVYLELARSKGTLNSWPDDDEEQMMMKEFGEEYKAYMQRTGRLFPK